MHKSRIALIALVAVISSSCATAKFEPGKPLTGGGAFETLLQDGRTVNRNEVRDYLKTQPETAELASQSGTWHILAIPPAAIGGFLLGYNLVDDNRTSDTGIWIGVGLAAIGIGMGAHADSLFSRAVDIYNQGLVSSPKKKSEWIRIAPIVGGDGLAPGALRAGLALSCPLP